MVWLSVLLDCRANMTNLRLFFPCLLLFIQASGAFAAEGSSDQRFLAGLRQRGLYRLAETYCRDHLDPLKHPGLSDRRRAELVIELSRCLAERAVNSPPEVRPPLWQRALTVTEDFARRHPQSPRQPLVRLQGELGRLARGELARQEAEVTADAAPLFEEAKTQLRAAIRGLEQLAEDVQRRLQQPRPLAPRETDALTADQLHSLNHNLQYQLARTLRNQAACYGPQSPDRANSLTRAVQLLKPLAGLDPGHPLALGSRVDLIVCYRLLADYAEARRQLDVLPAADPPPSVQLRAQAERIRLALATDRLSEAVSLLSQGRRIDAATSAELDYAWLQTYLVAAAAAGRSADQANANQWQAKATEMVERIEQLHGPYWTRRAGMLLSRYVQASPAGGDLAMLVRAAESSFRSGRLDDALATYDNARRLATKQGSQDRAFELGHIAAAVEHRRGRHREAMARYHQIATTTPQHPKAAEAHELAIYHAAQLAKKEPSQASLEAYAAMLNEHLKNWPQQPGAERVRRRLGRWYEHGRHWKNAIDAYRKISAGDGEHLPAVEAAARCYRAWFGERLAAGEPAGQIAAEAADAAEWFELLVFGSGGVVPQRLTPAQRLAALAAARLRLNYTPAGFAHAENVLSAALQGADDAPAEWKSAARALLVFSLAGGGRHREAGEVLTQISAGPPQGLFDMIEGLGRVAASARPRVRTELAELQLRAIDLLRRRHAQLSEAQQEKLQRTHARALADAGRIDEALAATKWLAEKHPRDGALQQRYAELLLTRKDSASMQTALNKWRELEKKSRPDSPRWYRAKYRVAWLHCEMGNKDQAAKIITLLRLLHPELGGPEMKAKFDELLRRCRP